MTSPEALANLMQKMNEQGRLIEAGWLGMRIAAVPMDASVTQVDEMRSAFFAGAQHLFTSIMLMMTEGDEVQDLSTLEKIQQELDEFIQVYQLTHLKSEGSA
ncbi:MAG: hypothetical protein H2043_06595 [Rhizobiales bacterium]|nr:hypothetical protein [Hyphomicrobiales bacterium]